MLDVDKENMEAITQDVLVVKVGTNTLIEKDNSGAERIDEASFRRIGQQILKVQRRNIHPIIVSSGAITAGMVGANETRNRQDLEMPELQRLASIGWRHVLNAWATALEGATVGELLLTRHDLEMQDEREEATQTIHCLLSHGDIPIINENDAISHEEIAFSDNDTLSAHVAVNIAASPLFCGAVKLLLLSDVNGVRSDVGDPNSVIPKIGDISCHIHLAHDTPHQNGTGGMLTKFGAGKIANSHNIDMWIANGREPDVISRAINGQTGTYFAPN